MGAKKQVWIPIPEAEEVTGYLSLDLLDLAEKGWVPSVEREGDLYFHREFLENHMQGWIGTREAEESPSIGYSASYLSRLARWRWVRARQVIVRGLPNWLFYREMLEARKEGWVGINEAHKVSGVDKGTLRWRASSGRLNAFKLRVGEREEIWLFERDDLLS